MRIDRLTDPQIGERLRLTREALRKSQTEFAKLAGINLSAYNQYELGKKRPSPETVAHLCDTYSLTSDWVYFGEIDNLPYALAKAIQALREASSQPRD